MKISETVFSLHEPIIELGGKIAEKILSCELEASDTLKKSINSRIRETIAKLGDQNNLNVKMHPDCFDLVNKSNYGKNPQSIDIALSLSEKYFAEEKFNEAFDLLIKEYIKYKNNKQNQIKQTLLKFFEALGNENEYTKIYRKKFSSIMFS